MDLCREVDEVDEYVKVFRRVIWCVPAGFVAAKQRRQNRCKCRSVQETLHAGREWNQVGAFFRSFPMEMVENYKDESPPLCVA